MAKPEWGKKRQCTSCGTKFYDLRKEPIVCPSCGEQISTEPPARSGGGGSSKRARGGKEEARKAAPAPAPAP